MKAFCGRVLSLSMSGTVRLKGVEIDVNKDNKFSFVPQEDILIGDFTAREMVTQNALMKLNKSPEEIASSVDKLLKDFGLGHVADNMIGTIFRRGLSGGQKKRVDVGIELVAPPTVLFLDEPTSGLDGSIAFEILSVIRRIVDESKGKLSVILSIHQPNENILQLFDHLLLLANDGMMFFGTLDESREYFASIGYPTPKGVSPTDFFLKVTDMNFSSDVTFNFESAYSCSEYAQRTATLIAASKAYGETFIEGLDDDGSSAHDTAKETDALVPAKDNAKFEFSENTGTTSFRRQTWTLFKREFLLASRDPTMYYLQFALHAFYGFMVGAAFFDLKFNIDDRMSYIPAGLAWIVFCNSYMHVFKVYHLVVHQARTLHETRNNAYSPLAAWVSDTVSCMILLVIYTPGFIFAYFMMDLPVEAFGFNVLVYWTVSAIIIN
jgi:ABC-type multidrug transport system ATPase subunit